MVLLQHRQDHQATLYLYCRGYQAAASSRSGRAIERRFLCFTRSTYQRRPTVTGVTQGLCTGISGVTERFCPDLSSATFGCPISISGAAERRGQGMITRVTERSALGVAGSAKLSLHLQDNQVKSPLHLQSHHKVPSCHHLGHQATS